MKFNIHHSSCELLFIHNSLKENFAYEMLFQTCNFFFTCEILHFIYKNFFTWVIPISCLKFYWKFLLAWATNHRNSYLSVFNICSHDVNSCDPLRIIQGRCWIWEREGSELTTIFHSNTNFIKWSIPIRCSFIFFAV